MVSTLPSNSALRAPKILLGIEQEFSARSLESVLVPEGFATLRAHTGQQTIDLAALASPDAIIIDSRLPDLHGLDVCVALRDTPSLSPQVPVILLTSGTPPRDFVVEAHRAGVWAIWEQPLDAEVLLLRLSTWLRAKQRADDVLEEALVDRVTGIYSHRGLQRRATEVITDAIRHGTPTSCIAIGVQFARSERGGGSLPAAHRREIAQTLAASARGADVVAHFNAAGFAVLAPATPQPAAEAVAQRLCTQLNALPSLETLRRSVGLDVVAGVGVVDAVDGHVGATSLLMTRASAALQRQLDRRDTPRMNAAIAAT